MYREIDLRFIIIYVCILVNKALKRVIIININFN